MIAIRGFIAVASLLFVFIASFFLLRDFIILNEEFSSSRAEILKEKVWEIHVEPEHTIRFELGVLIYLTYKNV